MKILVYGAGPMGSILAARLHEAGQDVSILARGGRLADIREHGIIIRQEGKDDTETAAVPAVEQLAPDDRYDLVMVVMRKNAVGEILPVLKENRHIPAFLFMMNNAAGSKEFTDQLGEDRVMLGFPLPGGELKGFEVMMVPEKQGRRWRIPVGEADGSIRQRTREIGKVLDSMRGYRVDIRSDMDDWLKCHAALLMPALAPALYASGISMKHLGNTRDLMVLALRGIREALSSLRKAGVATSPKLLRIVDYIPEPLWVALFGSLMRQETAKESLEGHAKGAREELKLINREVMEIIRETGVETPAIDALQPYYDEEMPLYPKGSRDIPVHWGAVIALLIVAAAAAVWAAA